jgi:hypothetical protein
VGTKRRAVWQLERFPSQSLRGHLLYLAAYGEIQENRDKWKKGLFSKEPGLTGLKDSDAKMKK